MTKTNRRVATVHLLTLDLLLRHSCFSIPQSSMRPATDLANFHLISHKESSWRYVRYSVKVERTH